MSNAFVKFLESAGEKCSLHFPFSGKQQKPHCLNCIISSYKLFRIVQITTLFSS